MKTPALTEPMRPLGRLEGLARVAHEEAMREHEAAVMVAEQRKAVGKEAVRKAIKSGRDPGGLARDALEGLGDPPARVRYSTSDASVEKLGELLRDNPRGILVYRDELTGLLRSLDREGHETARAFYLEAWNGTGGFTFDRIGRGTVEIEAACVSILGGIQPGPLGDYLRAAVAGGAGDDGLLQRFQVLAWPEPVGEWKDVDRWPDSAARERAWKVFDRLDGLDPEQAGGEWDRDGPPFLRFDPDAQDLFTEWRGALELRLRAGEEAPAFEAHLAKYRSLAPSLALLLHLADHERGPVREPALLAACAWCEYLEGHARRIYAPAVAGDMVAARELVRHLKAGDLGAEFTLRELVKKGWRALDATSAPPTLDMLAELGWLMAETRPTGGRPSVVWHVNPKAEMAEP
jgi:putative DNA primase/helicase